MANIKKTLLIGGAGFIGAHMVPLLNQAGRDVTIVGRSNEITRKIDGDFEYKKGDFGSLDFIKPLLESHDEIVHMAYASVPNTSFNNPLGDLQDNLIPSVQLFMEIAKLGKKLILLSSGGTVYGEQKNKKTKEGENKRPISPYGVTKVTLENYAFLYGVTHNLNTVIIRPSNAYGVGQLAFAGQGFIATAVQSAKLNKPIQIYGEVGTIRDYIYVTDLALGIVNVINKCKSNTAYNIATGVGYSNLDIVMILNKILKKYDTQLSVNHLPERPFDVKSNILDISKIQRLTNWHPVIDIENGIEKIVNEVFQS